MSFKQIVNGTLSYKLVLIEDSSYKQSDILLKAFVHEGISCGKEVHIVCFDHFPAYTKKLLGVQESSKLHTHDFFSDSLGWLKESSCESDSTRRNIFSSIQKSSSGSIGLLVVIDSLSSFILSHGFQEAYRQIHQFIQSDVNKGECLKQLVSVVSTDTLVNYEAMFVQLRYLATISVTVVNNRKPNQDRIVLKVVYRKSNGKFLKQNEECWIDSHCLLQSKKIDPVKDGGKTSDNNDISAQLTTFSIGLKEEEKVAKSQLVLPYLKTESEKAGGSIYYEPDANDDWDEEDPDDDLDI